MASPPLSQSIGGSESPSNLSLSNASSSSSSPEESSTNPIDFSLSLINYFSELEQINGAYRCYIDEQSKSRLSFYFAMKPFENIQQKLAASLDTLPPVLRLLGWVHAWNFVHQIVYNQDIGAHNFTGFESKLISDFLALIQTHLATPDHFTQFCVLARTLVTQATSPMKNCLPALINGFKLCSRKGREKYGHLSVGLAILISCLGRKTGNNIWSSFSRIYPPLIDIVNKSHLRESFISFCHTIMQHSSGISWLHPIHQIDDSFWRRAPVSLLLSLLEESHPIQLFTQETLIECEPFFGRICRDIGYNYSFDPPSLLKLANLARQFSTSPAWQRLFSFVIRNSLEKTFCPTDFVPPFLSLDNSFDTHFLVDVILTFSPGWHLQHLALLERIFIQLQPTFPLDAQRILQISQSSFAREFTMDPMFPHPQLRSSQRLIGAIVAAPSILARPEWLIKIILNRADQISQSRLFSTFPSLIINLFQQCPNLILPPEAGLAHIDGLLSQFFSKWQRQCDHSFNPTICQLHSTEMVLKSSNKEITVAASHMRQLIVHKLCHSQSPDRIFNAFSKMYNLPTRSLIAHHRILSETAKLLLDDAFSKIYQEFIEAWSVQNNYLLDQQQLSIFHFTRTIGYKYPSPPKAFLEISLQIKDIIDKGNLTTTRANYLFSISRAFDMIGGQLVESALTSALFAYLRPLELRSKGGKALGNIIDQTFSDISILDPRKGFTLDNLPYLHLCCFPVLSLQLLFRPPLSPIKAKLLKTQLLFSPFLDPLLQQNETTASLLWTHIEQFLHSLNFSFGSIPMFIILSEIELFLRSFHPPLQLNPITFDECAVVIVLAEFGVGLTQQQHLLRTGLSFDSIYAEFRESHFSDCGISTLLLPSLSFRIAMLSVLRGFSGHAISDVLNFQLIPLQPRIIQELMDARLNPQALFSRLLPVNFPILYGSLSADSVNSLKEKIALAWILVEYGIPWAQEPPIFDGFLPIRMFDSDTYNADYLLALCPSLGNIEKAAKLRQTILDLKKELPLLHHDRRLLEMQIDPKHITLDAPASSSCTDPSLLGHGATCQVRKATYLYDRVAIKLLAGVEEFEKEVIAWLHLRHSHVVTLYGVVFPTFAETRYQIVMELLDCDLHSLIYPKKLLAQSTMIDVTRQIVVGLNYIHTKELIHRDLKCRNILVKRSWDVNTQREQFQIKIGDFGMTRTLNAQGSANTLRLVAGTPGWMAPELFHLGSYPITGKIDVYALAIVLFEIFGYFTDIDYEQRLVSFDLMRNQILQSPPLNREQRPINCPSMTDIVWTLIEQCWHTNPNLRPSTDSILRDILFS